MSVPRNAEREKCRFTTNATCVIIPYSRTLAVIRVSNNNSLTRILIRAYYARRYIDYGVENKINAKTASATS